MRTAFAAALDRAGIHDFRFHDLRHTFASHMAMRGAGLKDLQELLGHKSLSMVLRYADLTAEYKEKAVNLLQRLTPCDGKTSPVQKCHNTKKSRALAAVK